MRIFFGISTSKPTIPGPLGGIARRRPVCDDRPVGLLTVLLVVLTFLAAAAAAYLGAPRWLTALQGTLVLLPATFLSAAGWVARRRIRGWPEKAWALVPATAALVLVAAPYLANALRGPDPAAAGRTIHLLAWALAGGAIAGIAAAVAFGLVALGSEALPVRAGGAAIAVAAFLAAQPILAAHGVPVVGPVALGLAIAVLAAARWLTRRRASAGPGSPDPR